MLSYIPEFLDKLCIKYLFDMTHLNNEITGVENEIKSCKNDFKNISFISNSKEFLKRENIKQNTKSKNNLSNDLINEKNEVMCEYSDKTLETFSKIQIKIKILK